MKKLIIRNFWLKVLALFLAIVAWLYVVGELNKGTVEEKALFDRMLPYKLAAKEIPIKINLIGNPPPGYRVLNEAVSVKPSVCLILAPKNLIKDISYVTTEEIDIGKFTRSIAREVKIKPLRGGIILEKYFVVNVVIPVEKIEQETKTEK